MELSRTQRRDIEPAVIRHFPFLSRRRRAALRNLHYALSPDLVDFDLSRGNSVSHIVVEMSSRSLELLSETFAPDTHKTLRFLRCIDRYKDSDSETRAILSYWGNLTDLSLHKPLINSTSSVGGEVRSCVKKALIAAQSCHADFMVEDVSVLTGESRAKFAALLTLFASTITGVNGHLPMIPRDITNFVMSRPENALDIVEFQRSLGMPFEDLDAALVETFLDKTSPALSSGLL